ncbi:GNAT family N-acetyltransferase [Paractinoplanes ferrugineus]|nr:GNAT family N-acetyltransferase [Actinoplanes ferrugineus]
MRDVVIHDAVTLGLFEHSDQDGKRGVGRMLAEAALAYAAGKRLRAVFDVMEKDRTAISMYERMGCVLLGRTLHHVAGGRTIPALCYAAPGAVDPAA